MSKLPVKGGVDRPLRVRAKNPQPRNVSGKPAKRVGSSNVRPVPSIKLNSDRIAAGGCAVGHFRRVLAAFMRAQMAIGFERVAKIRAGQGHQRASVDLF